MNKDELIAEAMLKQNLEAAMRKRKIPERMFEHDDRWPGGDISFMRPKERYGTDWQVGMNEHYDPPHPPKAIPEDPNLSLIHI